jgi:hypothetical protein
MKNIVLLSGLLLLMMFVGWAQTNDDEAPTCPAVPDSMLQKMLEPSAWVRANWNSDTSRWDIDCSQIDAIANMSMPASNTTMSNMTNALPRRARTNSTYVNTNPYKSNTDINGYPDANASNVNMAVNTLPRPKRRP